MATTSGNNLARKAQDLFVLPIDTTVAAGAINGGDACYVTANAGIASFGAGLTLNAALVALLASFCGISKDKNPLGSGGIINPLIYAGAQTTGVFSMNTTSGDTYKQFTPVTLGVDAQTITVAPVPAAPGASAVASGTGGTWTAAAHSVQYTYLTAIGETAPSPASSLTLTAGQNIVVTSPAFPAYALGVCVYVDGLFAGFAPSTSALTLAGPLSGSSAVRPVPLASQNALAIGYVDLAGGATGTLAASPNISGGAGITAPIRILPKYPAVGLR